MLVSRNKPDVIRKDFEMVGIVEELHRSLFPVHMGPTLASHGLRLDVAVKFDRICVITHRLMLKTLPSGI